MTHLVTILFWTLPALPIVVGVYGWRRGWQAGYDAACVDYSIAKVHVDTTTKESACDSNH